MSLLDPHKPETLEAQGEEQPAGTILKESQDSPTEKSETREERFNRLFSNAEGHVPSVVVPEPVAEEPPEQLDLQERFRRTEQAVKEKRRNESTKKHIQEVNAALSKAKEDEWKTGDKLWLASRVLKVGLTAAPDTILTLPALGEAVLRNLTEVGYDAGKSLFTGDSYTKSRDNREKALVIEEGGFFDTQGFRDLVEVAKDTPQYGDFSRNVLSGEWTLGDGVFDKALRKAYSEHGLTVSEDAEEWGDRVEVAAEIVSLKAASKWAARKVAKWDELADGGVKSAKQVVSDSKAATRSHYQKTKEGTRGLSPAKPSAGSSLKGKFGNLAEQRIRHLATFSDASAIRTGGDIAAGIAALEGGKLAVQAYAKGSGDDIDPEIAAMLNFGAASLTGGVTNKVGDIAAATGSTLKTAYDLRNAFINKVFSLLRGKDEAAAYEDMEITTRVGNKQFKNRIEQLKDMDDTSRQAAMDDILKKAENPNSVEARIVGQLRYILGINTDLSNDLNRASIYSEAIKGFTPDVLMLSQSEFKGDVAKAYSALNFEKQSRQYTDNYQALYEAAEELTGGQDYSGIERALESMQKDAEEIHNVALSKAEGILLSHVYDEAAKTVDEHVEFQEITDSTPAVVIEAQSKAKMERGTKVRGLVRELRNSAKQLVSVLYRIDPQQKIEIEMQMDFMDMLEATSDSPVRNETRDLHMNGIHRTVTTQVDKGRVSKADVLSPDARKKPDSFKGSQESWIDFKYDQLMENISSGSNKWKHKDDLNPSLLNRLSYDAADAMQKKIRGFRDKLDPMDGALYDRRVSLEGFESIINDSITTILSQEQYVKERNQRTLAERVYKEHYAPKFTRHKGIVHKALQPMPSDKYSPKILDEDLVGMIRQKAATSSEAVDFTDPNSLEVFAATTDPDNPLRQEILDTLNDDARQEFLALGDTEERATMLDVKGQHWNLLLKQQLMSDIVTKIQEGLSENGIQGAVDAVTKIRQAGTAGDKVLYQHLPELDVFLSNFQGDLGSRIPALAEAMETARKAKENAVTNYLNSLVGTPNLNSTLQTLSREPHLANLLSLQLGKFDPKLQRDIVSILVKPAFKFVDGKLQAKPLEKFLNDNAEAILSLPQGQDFIAQMHVMKEAVQMQESVQHNVDVKLSLDAESTMLRNVINRLPSTVSNVMAQVKMRLSRVYVVAWHGSKITKDQLDKHEARLAADAADLLVACIANPEALVKLQDIQIKAPTQDDIGFKVNMLANNMPMFSMFPVLSEPYEDHNENQEENSIVDVIETEGKEKESGME